MTSSRESAFRRNARRLAGVVLLGAYVCAGSLWAADAADGPAAVPIPDATLVDGPTSLSLGAEATLQLPDGWRFVPSDQLRAYWRGRGISAGPWDRGVVLPDSGGFELRLVFEPLGAVALEPLPQVTPLLIQAQALARAAQANHGAVEGMGRELAFWRWEPFYEPSTNSLRFGGVWRAGTDETVSMHVRWLARRGVLKLDWRGTEDNADAFSAVVERMEEGLQFNLGQTRAEAGPKDPVAKLDLSGLVLDGLFGRGRASAGPPPSKPLPLWAWALIGFASLAILIVGIVKGWRSLEAWLNGRAKAKQEAARLAHIERKYGGSAEDVEEIEEES